MSDNAPYTQIFVAYASEDKKAADTFLSHLKLLKRKHHVTISTNKRLQKADIALLLISVDFMISDAYDNIKQKLQNQPTTEIIPVLIRPCLWEDDNLLMGLNTLPANGIYVKSSKTTNERVAYRIMADELRKILTKKEQDSRPVYPVIVPVGCWTLTRIVPYGVIFLMLVLVAVQFMKPKTNLKTNDKSGEVSSVQVDDANILSNSISNFGKPIFESTDTSFKVLILRFEDYISKRETDCIGLSIKKLLINLKINKGMPIHPIYTDSILSPEYIDDARSLQEYHNADLLIYGLANQIKPECTGANVCFRHFVADTIMINTGVPDDITKVKHDLEYELISPFDIEQGKLSVDDQGMESWLKGLVALKDEDEKTYLDEIERMVVNISNLTTKEQASRFYNQGKAYYYSQNYEKAILSFDKAIEFDTNDTRYLRYKGSCYSFLKEYEKAAQIYHELKELDNNDASVYISLACNLRYNGKLEKSLEYINKAIELEPNNAQAYLTRIYTYIDLKKFKEAISDIDKAAELGYKDKEFLQSKKRLDSIRFSQIINFLFLDLGNEDCINCDEK